MWYWTWILSVSWHLNHQRLWLDPNVTRYIRPLLCQTARLWVTPCLTCWNGRVCHGIAQALQCRAEHVGQQCSIGHWLNMCRALVLTPSKARKHFFKRSFSRAIHWTRPFTVKEWDRKKKKEFLQFKPLGCLAAPESTLSSAMSQTDHSEHQDRV